MQSTPTSFGAYAVFPSVAFCKYLPLLEQSDCFYRRTRNNAGPCQMFKNCPPPPRARARPGTRTACFFLQEKVKDLWPTCVDLCCAVEMCESQKEEPHHAAEIEANELEVVSDVNEGEAPPGGKRARVEGDEIGDVGDEDLEDRIMAKYASFAEAVRCMGLGAAWRIPPLVGVS